jgi:hypothetical protein
MKFLLPRQVQYYPEKPGFLQYNPLGWAILIKPRLLPTLVDYNELKVKVMNRIGVKRFFWTDSSTRKIKL